MGINVKFVNNDKETDICLGIRRRVFVEEQNIPETIEMVRSASAFIFGSLIARSKSFEALNSFLKVSKFRVFDLNLRPPFYNQSLLFQLMQQSDMFKFND